MNFLLNIGFMLVIGFVSGWLLDRMSLPKIIGYIATGIAFSPYNFDFIDPQILEISQPLLEVSLAFIAFEIGGALKWSRIKKHEKEILSITLMASFFPFILIAGGIYAVGSIFPEIFPFTPSGLLLLALMLGALASPTAPAATLAVIHQYHAKGKVTDSILGVAALDDVLGILLFSLVLAIIYIFNQGQTGPINPVVFSLYQILMAMLIGTVLGLILDPIARFFEITGEGQWVVIIFSLIILCTGISKALQLDLLFSAMVMGIVVVNKSSQRKIIFRILERYTEDLIFLFFFLLSGLHLDMSAMPKALGFILIFVLLRTVGKLIGAVVGARLVNADHAIQKYTAGGLLPQAGIVIGLVLSIYEKEQFEEISELLLAVIMGATIIHELIGPLAAKYSLMKAGEIKDSTKR